MQVIVTGASGFIGRNVLLRTPRDWRVLALYHRSRDFEAFVADHKLTHVTPICCNLLDTADVAQVAEAFNGCVDTALYLAANGDPAASAERPRWDLESNTVALVNFLDQCSVGHLVYFSSGAVYDGLIGAVSPASPVNPRLPYAISKLASEQYVHFFSERRKRVGSFINVRFFGAYGPYEPARKITTRWLLAIAAGQREFVLSGDGRNLIDFMYIDAAVEGILALLNARGTSATVDFGGGRPITVNDIVEAMADTFGVRVTVRHEGVTEEYIRFQTSDRTMRDRFGIVPSIELRDGVRRLAAFLDRERVTP